MNLRKCLSQANTGISFRRWMCGVAVIVGILLGWGMNQWVTAESEDPGLSELAAELDAIKSQHQTLKAEWQAELLAQVVPTLAEAPERLRRDFVDFLEDVGNPGAAALTAMLTDPSTQVRREAVRALRDIGKKARKSGVNREQVVIGLAMALRDPSDQVFREGLRALADVRPASPASVAAVVPALIEVRTRGSSTRRDAVVNIVGGIGEELAKSGRATDAIRDILIACLSDDSTKVRTNAIEELSDMQAASVETFNALIGALADKSSSVRAEAEDALIAFGKTAPRVLVPLLTDAFESSTAAVTRGHIVDVLGKIGERLVAGGDPGTPVIEPLLVALRDTADAVRRNAADELGEMPAAAPEVKTALAGALEDPSKAVRSAARKALGKIEKME